MERKKIISVNFIVLAIIIFFAVHSKGLPEDQFGTHVDAEELLPRTIHSGILKNNEIDIRLPTALKPVHYVLKLQPFLHGNFSVSGYVEIEIKVLEATSNVTLHINGIITKNETVKVVPADDPQSPGVQITQQDFDGVRQFYIASLETELEREKRYILSMEFEAYLSEQLYGFYRSSYTDAEGNEVLLASTQFAPTDARRSFPCFDEPALKASFDIYIGREEEAMSSISNMPLNETIPIEGQEGWVWDHFTTSVPMSTYLVAFVVSDFVFVNTTTDDNVLFRVWSRKDAIQQATYSLEKGPEVLSFYEQYYSIPFPLPKQDMIAIPDFSLGGMENWGLINYRETAILYDPAVSSASNKQRVMQVIAHELAHQWFGNLVTPVWWNDIWLNEGFASFVEFIGTDFAEPTWEMRDQAVIQDLQKVFGIDSMESSHPVSVPVTNPDEINEVFDSISYSKGGSIIRMMNHFLTETTFTKGVTNYLNAFQYDNAVQDDLWEYLTNAGHEDGVLPEDMTVKQVMDTWTLQMGYPVIKVVRSSDGTTATVSQERFLLVENANSSDPHTYEWWVPLSYTTRENPDFDTTTPTVWMKDSENEITIDSLPNQDQWVIFNIQETGYFRVNYDENNWNLIIQQLLNSNQVIHVVNRAQIINDALDLARAGQLSYETALSVNSYLGNETDYIPWVAALDNLSYLEKMFTRHGSYGALRKYLLDLLVPLYDSVGFDDHLDDPHLEQYKRVLALSWTCHLEYADCVNNSVVLYQKWMENPTNFSIISPNLKSTVYCTAIADGGEEEWNFAWNQYLNSNVATERDTLLSAMGCTKEIWILSRYLELAYTEGSGIKKQDASHVFSSVARNDVGREIAWDFLRNQWELIVEISGTLMTLGSMVDTVSEEFNTEEEMKELELFKEEHEGDLGTATRAVNQAIERTANNIDWIDNNYDVIVQWLEEHGYSKK